MPQTVRSASTSEASWSPARAQYERDGYVIFRDVLDPDLIAEVRQHVDWLQRRHPNLRPENLHHRLVQKDPFWLRLVSDDRLVDIAAQFIGPDVALFASHYICKPAGDGLPVLWHQDGSYWPLEPMEVVTLWLAVDDATPENGCMRVIPGTQHLDLQELRKREDVENVLGSSMDDALVDESRAVDVALNAGDVSVHHPNVVHGSNANKSDKRRCGLTIRYIPTSTRIKLPEGETHPSAFLLRGKAVPGVNVYNPRPKYVEGECMPFRGCEDWK
jgi:phytanoyl-CoA hydroxylase